MGSTWQYQEMHSAALRNVTLVLEPFGGQSRRQEQEIREYERVFEHLLEVYKEFLGRDGNEQAMSLAEFQAVQLNEEVCHRV